MGVEPLSIDERPPCFIHQNCGRYEQPELRYWLRFEGAAPQSPQLEAGVLFEFALPLVPAYDGNWQYFGDPVPGFFGGSLTMGPLAPIPGTLRRLRVSIGTMWGGWNQTNDYNSLSCGWRAWRLLDPASAPAGWTACCVLAVRWYEHAEDVLASYGWMCHF